MSLQEPLPTPAVGANPPTVVDDPPPQPPAPVEIPEDMSLGAYQHMMSRIDDYLARPDFDPEAFVRGMRGKVDAVRAMLGFMAAHADWLDAMGKPIVSKAASIRRNRGRLEDYVTHVLRQEKACREEIGESTDSVSIPGHVFRARLRTSTPSVDVEPETATAVEFERFGPEFVSMSRAYSWNKKAIADAAKAGTLPDGLRVRLNPSYWSEFVPMVPEKLEPKTKGRKKKT